MVSDRGNETVQGDGLETVWENVGTDGCRLILMVSTFVQLAVDVLGELGAGLHVGGVHIERLAVGPSPLPLLHGLSAHTQYGAPEVLNLRVLHHLKLTHRHADGKPYTQGCRQSPLGCLTRTGINPTLFSPLWLNPGGQFGTEARDLTNHCPAIWLTGD